MRSLRIAAAALLGLWAAAAAADYNDDPRTTQLLATLKSQYSFSDADLDNVRGELAQAQLLPKLIHSEQTNKEKTATWEDYKPIHVNPANITNGLEFLREQKPWLERAHQQFGVPAEIVTALIGVETKYGTYTGKFHVLDALATLGYNHPTRADFFFGELTQFFVLCRDQGFDATGLLGSYAGAMGMAQFMPSNYRKLALDYDDNGRIDLWSPPDAIGSVANYLVNYDALRSWHRGQPVLAQLAAGTVPPASLPRNEKLPTLTVGALRQAGLVIKGGLDDSMAAGLLELPHDSGPPEYWVALPNFYAVMSYNPRVYYAMAVSSLAYELKRAESTP
jgi:membrane-bound lytic murein transglycosylase B